MSSKPFIMVLCTNAPFLNSLFAPNFSSSFMEKSVSNDAKDKSQEKPSYSTINTSGLKSRVRRRIGSCIEDIGRILKEDVNDNNLDNKIFSWFLQTKYSLATSPATESRSSQELRRATKKKSTTIKILSRFNIRLRRMLHYY